MSNFSAKCIRDEFSLYACTVLADPSDGGIVQKSLAGVKLDYLGLPHTKPMSAYGDPAERNLLTCTYCNLVRTGGRALTSMNVIPH